MAKRVFILGAGFSKPAGMPLATELLPMLAARLKLDDMQDWLLGVCERLAWLNQDGEPKKSLSLNIEEVFHLANFDIEVHRLRHQLFPLSRNSMGSPWGDARSIEGWLSDLEYALHDVMFQSDSQADLEPVIRWADFVRDEDAVLTFNYDSLVERALDASGKQWSHGIEYGASGVPVFKLHGSIDWIVSHRNDPINGTDLLYEKQNADSVQQETTHVEVECVLRRCRNREQLTSWIKNRELQVVPSGLPPATVGIAGLGAYKPLHRIPGLGPVWVAGMREARCADQLIFVGFSMSDFDVMAQLQFAQMARSIKESASNQQVIVIDPYVECAVERYRRVFHDVETVRQAHESFDWSVI